MFGRLLFQPVKIAGRAADRYASFAIQTHAQRDLALAQKAQIAAQMAFVAQHLGAMAGCFLRAATAAVGVAAAAGLGAAMWNASRAGGMVVDAFSVPPQYAQNGITGEVVATDLTDKIGAIRDFAQSHSFGNSQNVRKDSAEEIKVEIPEIGVSLGQVQRYLRLWLGHERHLSGNLRLLGEGKIALSMSLDGERGISVSGASGDLDRLEQQAAERIFASLEPVNVVLYLSAQGRSADGLAAAERATQLATGTVEQANAYSLWSAMTFYSTGNTPLAIARARIATATDARVMTGHIMAMRLAAETGHDEEALRQAQELRGLKQADQPNQNRAAAPPRWWSKAQWFGKARWEASRRLRPRT